MYVIKYHIVNPLWRSRVAGRARAIGNRVTVKSGSRVRIPPSPPGATAPPNPYGSYLLYGFFIPRRPEFRYTFCNAITGATAPLDPSQMYLRRDFFIRQPKNRSASPLRFLYIVSLVVFYPFRCKKRRDDKITLALAGIEHHIAGSIVIAAENVV